MEQIRRTKIVELLKSTEFGKQANVKGWVRTKRGNKQVNFIALNDGSCIHNIQIVVDVPNFDEALLKRITTGAAVSINGEITESTGSGQKVEIMAKEIEVMGDCDPEKYPIQPKKHTLEFLRENAHLRYRTNTFGAIARIRHAMIFAVHEFYTKKGFVNIHTP